MVRIIRNQQINLAIRSKNLYNENMLQKIKRQTLLLIMISFLGQVSISIINLGLIFYMRDVFRLNPQSIGLFAALFSASYFVGLLSLKRFVSAIPPPKTILFAAVGMFFCGTAILVVKSALPAYVLYALYGMFMSIFWPPLMGWISRKKEKKELGQAISYFNISWSGGIILGPFFAGMLAERSVDYAIGSASAIMLIIIVIMAVASGITSIKTIPSNHLHKKEQNQKDESTYLRYTSWIGIFPGYFVYGITMNIFPIYAQDVLNYPESTIGLLLLIRGLFTVFLFILMGKTYVWQFRISSIVGFQILLAGSLLIGLTADTISLLTIFFILFGVSFSGIYTNSIFHGAAGSTDREHRMVIHEAILTTGMVAGSLSGGILYQRMSFSSVMILCLIITAAAVVVQIAIFLTKRKSAELETG